MGQRNILVVEDEPLIAMMLEDFLESLGHSVTATCESVQDAMVEALRVWPEHPPRDPRGWLTTVAMRRLVDARRSESARRPSICQPTSRHRPVPTSNQRRYSPMSGMSGARGAASIGANRP